MDPPVVDPPPIKPPPPPRGDPPVDLPTVGGVIRAHTQEQIIGALQAGRFCVTDGPAVRIAIDRNANRRIDDHDIQMGDVFEFQKLAVGARGLPGGQNLVLLTECISTPEFGPITEIDVYVGVHPRPSGSGEPVGPRLYAPTNHGIFPDWGLPQFPAETYISNGRTYVCMTDNYWQDQRLTTGTLAGEPLTFTAVTVLDLDSNEVGRGIPADRFFVRAFVRTRQPGFGQIAPRYGFSNPIWLLRSELASDPAAGRN